MQVFVIGCGVLLVVVFLLWRFTNVSQWLTGAFAVTGGGMAARSRLYDSYLPPRDTMLRSISDDLYKYGVLTREQISALRDYTGAYYAFINKYARTGIEEMQGIRTRVEHMDAAFERAPPLFYPLKVFRAVRFNVAEKLAIMDTDAVNAGECNSDVSGNQFLSTSTIASVSERFLAKADKTTENRWVEPGVCCFLRINIPVGTSVIPLEEITNVPHEHEVLLPRTTRLRFLGRGYHRMNIHVMGDAPPNEAFGPPVGNFPMRPARIITTNARVYDFEVCAT